MNNISVIILTKNEEKNILDCLDGVFPASEIIIVDDYSTDRTLEVVSSLKKRNIKIFMRSLNSDFSGQRNFGLLQAKNKWVMFVDADERVSRLLFDEIIKKIKEDDVSGLRVKRIDTLWGRRLEHGETGNISLVRLGKKDKGKWSLRVHETWKIKGRVGELDNELVHYPHQDVRAFLREVNYYSSIRAEELFKKGIRSSLVSIIIFPKIKFFLNYFIKLGFMDGTPGLIVALMMSFHSYLVRGKLWLLANNER